MDTVRFLFCLLLFTGIGRNGSAHSSAVREIGSSHDEAISRVLTVAVSQLQVREATGNNDGPQVEKYLAYVGFKKGNPWCAAFVSWCFGQAGYPAPRTAWSPALFPPKRIVAAPFPGIVFGIYFENLKRIGHCGLIEKMQGDVCFTIEGNTNSEGGREGNGVFRRLRHRRTIRAFSDWM